MKFFDYLVGFCMITLVVFWILVGGYVTQKKIERAAIEKHEASKVKVPEEARKGPTWVDQRWETTDVKGEVECFHIWGRTAIVKPVKAVLVRRKWWDGRESIIAYADIDPPVIDGKRRTGYSVLPIEGNYDKEFPEYLQMVTDKKVIGVGEHENIHITRSAVVSFKDGKPTDMLFIQGERAMFNVPEFIQKLRENNSILAEREIEYLQGFNAEGFRIRQFEAVFK
jgi:hypothetical protein